MNDNTTIDRNTNEDETFEELHALASVCLSGKATEHETRALESLVLGNDELRSLYVRYMYDSTNLRWLSQSVPDGADEKTYEKTYGKTDEKPVRSTEEAVEQSKNLPVEQNSVTPHWIRQAKYYLPLGILAISAVFLTALSLRWAFVPTVEPKKVARIRNTIDSSWMRDGVSEDLAVGDWLMNDTYTLQSGTAKVEFSWGTEVTLEAPATLVLTTGQSHRLIEGQLVASVAEEDTGFEIETPSVRVIDLGTEFGVSVDKNGESEVHVFKGSVETRTLNRPEGQSTITLLANEARVFNAQDGQVHQIAFNAKRFSTAWKLASRIARTQGAMQFIHPPPINLVNGFPERNDSIYIFQERKDVKLSEPLSVTMTLPGLYTDFSNRSFLIAEGEEFDSYLLHFDPVGSRADQPAVSVTGSITFDRPILGVITRGDQLVSSDAVCSAPGTQYTTFSESIASLGEWEAEGYYLRGLMGQWNASGLRSSPAPNDRVSISNDRLTLSVTCSAGGESEQLRVLVASKPDAGFAAISKRIPSSKPYYGRPFEVNEIIQAEDYDRGVEGIAYFDNTPNALARSYRTGSSVELRAFDDSHLPDCLAVVRARPREWLAYTVQIDKAGTYVLDTRMISNHHGSVFHAEFGEHIVTKPIVMPRPKKELAKLRNPPRIATSQPLELEERTYVMRIVMDQAHRGGWIGNFDWLKIRPATDPASQP